MTQDSLVPCQRFRSEAPSFQRRWSVVIGYIALLYNRAGASRIAGNVSWLISEKLWQMAISLITGVWMARYLGPAQYGMLAYASSFVSLFLGISSLGLGPILLRDLVRNPETSNQTLGTAFILQLTGGFVALLLVLILARSDSTNNSLQLWIIACASTVLISNAFKVIESWFQAHSLVKYPVWISNTTTLIGALTKGILIYLHASLYVLSLIIVLEALANVAGLLTMLLIQDQTVVSWRWNTTRAKQMLASGWPLMISGIVIMIYIRTDQILIKHMLGEKSLGLYSVVTRLTEMWYFVPTAIATAVFPSLVRLREKETDGYLARLQNLCVAAVICSLVVAIPVTLFGPWLIKTLFGAPYLPAAGVLRIYVWSSLFVFLGTVSSQWFIHEGLQLYSLYRNAAGAVVNVALNLFLIPYWGITGSAIATLVAVSIASYLANAFNPKTRLLFRLHTNALLSTFNGTAFRNLVTNPNR